VLEPGAQFGETFAAILLKILALKAYALFRVRPRWHRGQSLRSQLTFKTTGILGEEWSKWTMVVNDGDGLELFSFGMSTARNGTGK
jgi:hypothetical protein